VDFSNGSQFKPTVLKVDSQKEFRWLGKLALGGYCSRSTGDWLLISVLSLLFCRLFDGEHYFVLEDDIEGTKLRHGEKFSGLFTAGFITRSFTYVLQLRLSSCESKCVVNL